MKEKEKEKKVISQEEATEAFYIWLATIWLTWLIVTCTMALYYDNVSIFELYFVAPHLVVVGGGMVLVVVGFLLYILVMAPVEIAQYLRQEYHRRKDYFDV